MSNIKLWDRLLRLPETNDPLIEAARRDLKLPRPNHAGALIGPEPLAERFVFSEGIFDELSRVMLDDTSRSAAIERARVPCFPAWIEAGRYSWHFWLDADGAQMATFFLNGRSPLTVFNIGDVISGSAGDINVALTSLGARIQSAENVPDDWFGAFSFRVVFLLAVISSPRAASVRRRLSGEGLSAADRAMRLRRAQAGRPMFSFNEVILVPAKTALHRGVLQPVESFAGMRGHVVMGHWRLIDGKIEPYWIWVDGHRRGNDRLGTIVKQRNVGAVTGRWRKGFQIPDGLGLAGERRPARSR